jgi:hypothetical protein
VMQAEGGMGRDLRPGVEKHKSCVRSCYPRALRIYDPKRPQIFLCFAVTDSQSCMYAAELHTYHMDHPNLTSGLLTDRGEGCPHGRRAWRY